MGRRSARTSPATTEPVTWRDGVHVVGTAIWCDARRARDVCFVSSADAIGRVGHGQLIATLPTIAQLGTPAGAAAGAHLSVPYRRPFTLGTVRLELVPSGHAMGAASLWIDSGGARTFYAGPISTADGGRDARALAEPAELRSCETLIVAAPYGAPGEAFPKRADAIAAWLELARAAAARGAIAVALVSSAQKGLDVVAASAGAGLIVAAHRAIHHAARRLIAAKLAVPEPRRSLTGAQVLVWPVRERARLSAALGARASTIALVSGAAIDPGALAAAGAAHAVAWSNAADRRELLAFIESSTADRVYLTGRRAEAIAATLGARARVLAPPQQMALFEVPAGAR
jgi:Cft2 family RNA processing exonuclease